MISTEFDRLSEPPLHLSQWEEQRPALRRALWRLLGDLPNLFTPQAIILNRTEREGYVIEKLIFDNGAGAQVPGYFLLPTNQSGPIPAVIYEHLHGGKYDLGKDELFVERIPGIATGEALVKAGFAVLAMDAYGFGERQTQGPGGDTYTGAAVEQAHFKHFLWQGITLWGMMVRDDLLALNYLVTRPEVDATRIGVTGMSLGASRTTWLAALDDRLQVIVPVAQMTRYHEFAQAGKYNFHGIYYYVPGILKSGIDMEHLAALAAPRRQAILIGDADPLSPFEWVQRVQAYIEKIYDLYGAGAQLTFQIESGMAHEYTQSMFTTMIDTLRLGLGVER